MTSRALNIIVYVFCLFFIGVVSYSEVALWAQSAPTLTYHVYIYPGQRGIVEATLKGVNVPSVNFRMLNISGWGYHNIDVVGNISDVTAEDLDGNNLSVTGVSGGWLVNTSGKSGFTFSYTFGTSLYNPSTYPLYLCLVIDRGGFFENDVIFAYPDLTPARIEVVFHKPESWTVGTSLLPLGGDRYEVPSVSGLQYGLLDETTRMGVAEAVISQACDDLEITFICYQYPPWDRFWYPAYGNTLQEQMQEYIDLNCDTICYFRSVFGFWPGSSRYWISNFPTWNSESRGHLNRWMQAWPRERYQQVPHHILHGWIWWSDNAPLHCTAQEWMWVQEGIPTYYESQLTPALTGNSMWRGMLYPDYLIAKRAAHFGLLRKTSVNKYAYSCMRAFAMDRKISEVTHGQKSLDHLLTLLGQRYGLERKHFGTSELITAINEVAGTDLSEFYQRHFAGEVSSELPPVDAYMGEYVDDFLRWLDYQLNSQTFMNWAKGYRTMFFIDLEMGLHSPPGYADEHMAAKGSGLYHLEDFRRAMAGINPVTEEKVISVLSSLTDVDQSDFFDFYTISGWRPSVAEIQAWLDPTNYIPDITITPGSVSFGRVNVGNTSDQTITIRNDGSAILTVGTITSPSAPFRKVADNCSNKTLSPQQTCIVTYRFAPTSAGTFNSNSNIPSNDPDESNVTVTLSGTGRLQNVTDLFSDVASGYWAQDYIVAIYNAGITTGCAQDDPNTPENERRYCPEDNVTREQMAAFIVRAKEGEPAANYCDSGTPFPDVTSDMWSCKYIKRLKELGITTGYQDGTYGPYDFVPREQMAAFIVRAVEGEPPANYCDTSTPFPDVTSDMWSCRYIKRLKELGITTGYQDGTYGPYDIVTRAQMAAFLARAFLGME